MPTLERATFGVVELRRAVTTFRDQLDAHRAAINQLNVYPVPDADTGTNMCRTVDAVVAALGTTPDDLAATCAAISDAAFSGARGNSGVILSQVLGGLASTLRAADRISPATLAAALRAASHAADRTMHDPVEGTILTVVRASADGAETAADAGGGLSEVVVAARDAGRRALAATREMLPELRAAGVVDAGGLGYLLFLDALANVVAGEPLPDTVGDDDHSAVDTTTAATGGAQPDQPRYEVMYLCDLPDERIEAFKQRWAALGDSIAVAGGAGRWKCHVHTNDIGAAIEAALELGGRPRDIRVTDLVDADRPG